jgi:hypothetical protein
MITSKSAVDVTNVELHLWILQHSECWNAEKDCYDIARLQRTWEDKYGALSNTEQLKLGTVAHAAKHTVYDIRRNCVADDA